MDARASGRLSASSPQAPAANPSPDRGPAQKRQRTEASAPPAASVAAAQAVAQQLISGAKRKAHAALSLSRLADDAWERYAKKAKRDQLAAEGAAAELRRQLAAAQAAAFEQHAADQAAAAEQLATARATEADLRTQLEEAQAARGRWVEVAVRASAETAAMQRTLTAELEGANASQAQSNRALAEATALLDRAMERDKAAAIKHAGAMAARDVAGIMLEMNTAAREDAARMRAQPSLQPALDEAKREVAAAQSAAAASKAGADALRTEVEQARAAVERQAEQAAAAAADARRQLDEARAERAAAESARAAAERARAASRRAIKRALHRASQTRGLGA